MLTVKMLCIFAFATIFFLNFSITNAFRIFNIDGKETILASENENIKIQCKSDFPMTYCGFMHPSGKRFSFTDGAVSDGKCVQQIKVTKADNGEWGCHIGRQSVRLETIKKIQVRIVNKVAALEPNITAKLGHSITIACATTKGLIPLSYCRFEPPTGTSFNIDSSVTVENSILGKYYFPLNASLDRGDCAVTIAKVKYEDVGLWTCGAGLDDGKEHTDVIRLEVEGMYKMSTASATGVTVGGILVAVALGSLGYIAWKKRTLLGVMPPQPEVIEIQEFPRQRSASPRQDPAGPSSRFERIKPIIIVQSPSTPGDSGTEFPRQRSASPRQDPAGPSSRFERIIPIIVVQSPSTPGDSGTEFPRQRSASPRQDPAGPSSSFERIIPIIVVQSPSTPGDSGTEFPRQRSASPRQDPAGPSSSFERIIPIIVVQSPSTPGDSGTSPLMSRSPTPM